VLWINVNRSTFREKDFIMTSFVHTNFPTEHPGVERAQAVMASVRKLGSNVDSTKTMATLLMAALVAALVVVANQVISTWADGQLLLAWALLWAFAFSAMAFAAPAIRRAVRNTASAYRNWNARLVHSRAEAQYWESAQNDSRIMADLRAAQTRSGAYAD
jgi:hypothetical protein